MIGTAELTPLPGSPAALNALSGDAARASAALTATRSGLLRLEQALDGQQSRAVDAARALLTELRAEAAVCTDVLTSAATALSHRAVDLAHEQREALAAIAERDTARGRLDSAVAAEAEAWRLTFDPLDPRQVDAGRLAQAARARAAQAQLDITAAEARWTRARDAHESGSRRTAPLLDGLSHERAVRAASVAGVDLTAFGHSWRRGVELAGITDRDELAAALLAAPDDPILWTAFWETTTPDQVFAVIDTRAFDDDVTASLSAGIEAWAETASPADQQRFGYLLVSSLPAATMELGGRGDLAAALLAPTVPGGVHHGAADALVEHRDREDALDTVAVLPLSLAIARGLAAHPDAALDHLGATDEDVLVERTDAWFGHTPRGGWPDGGTAVAGMFAAAITAGTRSTSTTDQGRAALLASHATTTLTRDGALLGGPTPVSRAATKHIVDAYEPYLPSAGDHLNSGDGTPPPEPGVNADFELAENTGAPARVVQPYLNPFALRDVVAATSGTGVTAGYWLGATDRYLDDMVEEVRAADETVGRRLSTEAVRDGTVVTGAIESSTITMARDSQATAEDAADWTFAGLSLFTKGTSSIVTTGAGMLMRDLLPDQVGAAHEQVLAIEPELRAWSAGRFHEVAEERDWDATSFHPDSRDMRDVHGLTYDLATDTEHPRGASR